jgi:O-antigen ligase
MKYEKIYTILTLLVIAISGNPLMGGLGKETIYIGTLMIFLLLWWFKPQKLSRQDVLVFALFFLLTITHMLSFGLMVVVASLGFLIKLSIALLAVRLIPEFSRRYVSLMYVLSLISLIFFIPSWFGVDLESLFSPISFSFRQSYISILGIYYFYSGNVGDALNRNVGVFWEPGAFAGYLILALLFLISRQRNKSIFSKQGLVMIFALLSTLSTTGYLAFIVLVVFYLYKTFWVGMKVVKRMLVFPVLIAVFTAGTYAAINEVSFLGEKISGQMETSTEGTRSSKIGRIGNFLYDLDWIAQKPMFGWSATQATRALIDTEVDDLVHGQGNGLTGFTVRFGLVGLFILVGFITYTTWRLSGSLIASLFGVVIVCMLLNGEQFLNFPMFLSLMFLPQKKSKSLSVLPVAVARKTSFAG